jgi:hypothetical protein
MNKRALTTSFFIFSCFLLGGTAFGQMPYPPATPPQRQPRQQPQQQPPPQQQSQQDAGAVCPQLLVQAQPGGPIRDGQKVYFTVNFNGGDTKNMPTIVWNTTAGVVTSGQGTNHVEVDSTGAGGTPDREIKAEVWVSGFAADCVLQASAAVKVIAPATKFGDFGELAPDALNKNLKALADYMGQIPDNLYVIAYAGRNSDRNFTMTWVKRIRDGLVANGVESRRVMTIDGGFQEQPLFDFWIVPNGSEPPRPAPTVKRSEIVYPKTTPQAKKP